MRRLAPLPLLALLALLAGCGAVADGAERVPLRLAEPAAPQSHELGWRESYAAAGRSVRFEVHDFTVRDDGWSARVAIENRTRVAFELGAQPLALAFGLMLFADGTVESLEKANRAGALPAVRRARTIEPEPPERIGAGVRWETTLSAPGSLPSGSYVRVVFGTLVAVGEPPEGLQPSLVWITDHALRLR
jgi:hypothetical protein